ncbi:hypothetical protein SAMN05661012_00372 [Chitinophaga sancti]|uniref:Uncharacterized protein n=1 Tax=Chitinophaga sancti TaxID=1004 RepID=A0A1K1M1N0_9BACT|nr:hypothetical protein SAMN05661012_00372 [Chitinophaga sancti]
MTTGTIKSTLTSNSIAFRKQSHIADSSSLLISNFILAIRFDKRGIPTLGAFVKNNNGIDGQIMVKSHPGNWHLNQYPGCPE